MCTITHFVRNDVLCNQNTHVKAEGINALHYISRACVSRWLWIRQTVVDSVRQWMKWKKKWKTNSQRPERLFSIECKHMHARRVIQMNILFVIRNNQQSYK